MSLFPYEMTFFGPEPRAERALQCDPAQVTYKFPGTAASASTGAFLAGINAKVRLAHWQLMVTPKGVGCGVELIEFSGISGGVPQNMTQVAELTGSAASSGPLHYTPNVTAQVRAIIEEHTSQGVPTASQFNWFLGHRLKGDGTVGPLVYVSRMLMILEV